MSEPTCPNCGAPKIKGTGLYQCGEGVRGFVQGGCRVYYTARYIRQLRAAASPAVGVPEGGRGE